ncbi:probable receptor-like protein kinase at5g24010 [Phtheirospermum japonicum]|uniref:Probable receptor-like protein kinase at5g24010 n=1 Tax=Phtheirospermum japonicum TaxID=374723 RepID=A0A830D7T0_9LAMI|nr:probable receptor-like protein kinase at5g24010 [Phtheirospermum japonicum]
MDAKSLHFLFLTLSIFLLSTAFTPQDNYLINCGSSSATLVVDNRHFVGDSDYLSQGKSSLSLSNPSPNSPALYSTARVFTSASSYKFKIKNIGTHLVRLHFSPFNSPNYDLKVGKFSVLANGFSLLSSFSSNSTTLKEFFLTVDKNELEILFRPFSNSNFGYVSAIEVFSAPKDFFIDAGGIALISPDGIQEFKQNITDQVLETVHRINVGGPLLTPSNDTLWRTWIPDEDFLVLKSAAKVARTTHPPNYQTGGATRENAPDNVYMTAQQMNIVNRSLIFMFNITWDFPVTSSDHDGDLHFVRLHFCDIVSVVLNTLYFDVYINGVTAYKDVDLSMLVFHRLASPYYMDFVVKNVRNSGIVRISVGPSDLSSTLRKNAILNGVEIMRMVNFVPSPVQYKKKSKWVLVGSIVGGSFALILTFLAILALLKCRPRKPKPKSRRSESSQETISEPGPYGYHGLKIPFADLQSATNNFDKSLIIGSGGFGLVYKGVLSDNIKVAVKRGVPGSRQGLPEFQTEITILSKIRHHHLVSLVGYCEEQSEMILVYEYMEKGPLRHHLYGQSLPPLSWKQRLEICIGAARGLHYLHTGSAQGIIHRDIKSTNILLDESHVAKVADFGLSKSGPCVDETHVSTGVKGSFGYLDPEYFRRQQLTDKSDVYSFGVVLFEVLCARPAVDLSLNREQVNLGEWAMEWQKKGTIEQIVDPRIVGEIKSSALRVFGETAEKCLAEYGVDRPSMGDVLWNLEYAYQLQTNEGQVQQHRVLDLTGEDPEARVVLPEAPAGRGGADGDSDDVSSELSTSRVFSQLITNEGR